MSLLRVDDPALLGRTELIENLAPILASFPYRRVLLTGAGGSLGHLLAATLARVPGIELSLVDHHEHSLFALERALPASIVGACSFALADVRDTERMTGVMRRFRPQVVFHFAAYKHIHYGERFPTESVGVNVLATRALLQLSEELGTERFVYPSSDKAVEPSSLYGATKRLAEVLVLEAAARGRAYTTLRYVNVLGTRGSVLETFAEQIAAGEPLTVTDPAMARYWISQREAAWLALEASLAPMGSLLLLDLHQEVPVVEMARRLAAQLGPRGQSYPVIFSGTRPGERLREPLVARTERCEPGPRPGLVNIVDRNLPAHLAAVGHLVDELASLRRAGEDDALREAAMRAARELQ